MYTTLSLQSSLRSYQGLISSPKEGNKSETQTYEYASPFLSSSQLTKYYCISWPQSTTIEDMDSHLFIYQSELILVK